LAVGWFTVSEQRGCGATASGAEEHPFGLHTVDERRLEVRQENDLQAPRRLRSIVPTETGDDHTSLASQIDVDAEQAGRAGDTLRRHDLPDAEVETLEVVERDHGLQTRNEPIVDLRSAHSTRSS
jgi:hypothetical protein